MRKLTYYVATTLDGFIAGPDGEFDFFPLEPDVLAAMNAEVPETVPTHIRPAAGLTDAPNLRFDTVLMGRGTYEPALKEGITSPYAHLRQYVFSRTLNSADPAVEIVSADPVPFVRQLKQQAGLDIWLSGGGNLAGQLRTEIDDMVIKRYPLVIGAGIPLFDGPFGPTGFTVTGTRAFESGTSVTTYIRT
ncbi:dihydrofolate reductase family protein [Plantactinospora sp. S1510]|uniref:Dihydrofolate reductase family protein n=1 Tax=Plantactinospora alkalitolerans TaxID=2789879 RepID=A0ABS0GRZ8_9ACTN|nr:dihydrofolate reductase family protein [Plantactinospora alkalitolerans]MBF9128955.1 dihydrofolate reductase family protein [Plantactinospora alkalitolerans]